jgi:hypothetical protein
MGVGVNFAATGAGVAAVYGPAVVTPARLLAVQRFGQHARDRFQLVWVRAMKEVGVPEAPLFETALQQCHGVVCLG